MRTFEIAIENRDFHDKIEQQYKNINELIKEQKEKDLKERVSKALAEKINIERINALRKRNFSTLENSVVDHTMT